MTKTPDNLIKPHTTDPEHLGQAVLARRRNLRMSQAELASLIGVTRQSVISMEKGSPGLSVGTILKALGALGLTMEVTAREGVSFPPAPRMSIEKVDVSPSSVSSAGDRVGIPGNQATPVMADIDRIIDDARSGTRYPNFQQPLPSRPRKHNAGEAL